ncbi:MAG: cytochrome c biogenesis CcdA family protein [Candidatus Bathyarchaeia archaeon]
MSIPYLYSLLIIFASGLSSIFSPCLFPILPIFVAYITGAKESQRRGITGGVAFTLGIVLSFLAYGFVASYVGTFFIAQHRVLTTFLGLIIVFLGIVMLTPMSRIFWRITPTSFGSQIRGELGAFVVGVTFAFIAAPCAAPVLLSLMLFLAAMKPFQAAISSMVYSLGVGIPFIILGALAQRVSMSERFSWLLKRSHQLSGILLILLGIPLILGWG